jgi:enolase
MEINMVKKLTLTLDSNIIESAKEAGFKNKTKIILDAAASSFFKKGKYSFEGKKRSRKELLDFYSGLLKKYPEIIGIEDPFSEEDWQGWRLMNSKFKKLLIIGDDLTVTNPKRIKLARKRNACNAVIIKPNQIGTVSEAITAAKLAKSYGWKIIVSHRSGETMDDFIADLAVGVGADFIKSGAPSKPERMAKYSRLLKIEKEIHG